MALIIAAMSLPPLLSPDLRRTLDAALASGERVRWAAQPRASGMWAGFGIYVFAIPWTAFALFWESMALIPFFAANASTSSLMKYGFGIVFPLFGVPFIVAGLWMLSLPIRAMLRSRHTVHAITDRRLLTIVGGADETVKSALIDRIGPIERKSGRDGWGWVRIQTHSRVDSEGDRITEQIEWLGIPQAARVEQLILEAQEPR